MDGEYQNSVQKTTNGLSFITIDAIASLNLSQDLHQTIETSHSFA